MKSFTATASLTAPLRQQSRNVSASSASLPTLDDTFALLVQAARSACSLRLRFGSQMPWGTSKKAALQDVADACPAGIVSPVDSPVYKQHERNWTKLVKAERIHLMSRTTSGCFYLPGFLLTKTVSDSGNDWTVNREAVAHFAATGAAPAPSTTPNRDGSNS